MTWRQPEIRLGGTAAEPTLKIMEEDDMKTFIKRVQAMQINTIKDCRCMVEMIPSATLVKDGNRIEGINVPRNLGYGHHIVLFGDWIIQNQDGVWSRVDNMDGWTAEAAQ